MSFFVTRPPRPVPCTWFGSTPCSEAIRATTGETNVLPFSVGAGGAGVDGADGAESAEGATSPTPSLAAAIASSAACCVAGSGGASASCFSSAAGAGAPPGAETASFVPTSTVSPSWTRICWRTPSPGLGTSVSTLSVEISSSASSAATDSPSCFSHFVIVPSETETPICGITTSIAWVVATPLLLVLGEFLEPCRHVGDLRDERLLERRREGHGGVGSRDPLHRRVEVLEGLLGDRRCDLGAEAAGASVLVQHEHFRGLADALEHGGLVPGHDRAQVDDLDRHVVFGQLLRGLLGGVDHCAPRDDADVLALLVDARLADRDRDPLVRHLGLDAAVEG